MVFVRTVLFASSLLGAFLFAATVPAGAAQPTAPLTASAFPDGSRALTWTLEGSSDSINVLPHLRCAIDPEVNGLFPGAKVPCLWLVDHKAPAGPAPDGCPSTGDPYASWRCDMRAFRFVLINAAYAGQRSLIQFNTKAKGGSGICAWIPVAVRINGGQGTVLAADGCPQRIICLPGSTGKITVDPFDTVSGCPSVAKDGSTDGSSTTSTGSTVDLKTCAGAGAKPYKVSPLYDVRTTKHGRRGMRIRVTLRRAVPFTVQIRRTTSFGSMVVREIARCGKVGANDLTVPDVTNGRKAGAGYRLVVRSPRSSYPLRSSEERLPR